MNRYITYIVIYLVGGLLGWIWESLLGTIDPCGDTLNKQLDLCLPFLNIYGLGAVLLLLMSRIFSTYNIFLLSFISALLLAILECILGSLSKSINGFAKWNYVNQYTLPLCDGFVALQPFLLWFFFSFLFFLIARQQYP